MRVAIVTEVFLPKVDGVVNTLCHLLDYLDEQGHESILIAPSGAPQYYRGTKVVLAPATPLAFYPEINLAYPWPGLQTTLDHFHPQVIHAINPIFLGAAGVRYGWQKNIPVISSYHTDLAGFAERWGFGFSKELIWSYLRWIHNHSDLNLCPSRATLIDLVQHNIQRVKIWSRGVDTRLFNPTRACAEWRWQLTEGNPKAPLLLYVGRLSAEKRVEWIKPILEKIPDARLAIVGDGPRRGELERLFSGTSTVFCGYLNGEDLAHAYASSDVFVFPAANETFGNVALEAMASGLPVIAPRAGGVLDIVKHEKTGLLFDAEDTDSFMDSVYRLVERPIMAREFGLHGYLKAQQKNWGSVMNTLMDDYEAVSELSRPVNKHFSIRKPVVYYQQKPSAGFMDKGTS